MTKTIQGTVHGRTIELAEDLGLGAGQQVELQVTIVQPPKVWGEGLRRCAGALADEWSEEDDHILEAIHQSRSKVASSIQ